MILEPLVGVVIQHLRPKIGVVAGRIAAVPDMAEVAGSISRRHCAGVEMRFRKGLALECIRILQRRVRRQHMPLHVEFGGRQHFRQRIAGVEVLRLLDFLHQGFGHGGARFVVPRIVIEHGRIKRPVLIELRRELDEIPRGSGSGEARIAGVGEHPVQRVAELMKHRRHIVKADQSRLARRRFR